MKKSFASILFLSAMFYVSSAARADVSGLWVLDGPGTESDVLLTEEGLRLQAEYDLLSDGPNLSCIPASVSRVWASPSSRSRIEITDSVVSISYELFDLRREIPIRNEAVQSSHPSTQNINGTYLYEMGSSVARIQGN